MKKSNSHGPCSGHPIFLFSNTQDVIKMRFRVGDVYLFHRSDIHCPSTSSLWGQYDKQESGRVYLESSSRDLRTFRKWHALPWEYRYCRRASRSELRDYAFALCWSEIRNPAHHPPPVGNP